MPQLSGSFILNSKASNFTRDSFKTLHEMYDVNPCYMDEGHISYCSETDRHYIFHSIDNNVYWTELNISYPLIVDGITDLNDELAKNIPAGSLVYVKENFNLYYNTYTEDNNVYLEGVNGQANSGYFYPLSTSAILEKQINDFLNSFKQEVEGTYATKDEVSELNDVSKKTYATKDEVSELNDASKKTYATKDEVSELSATVDEFDDRISDIKSATDKSNESIDDIKGELEGVKKEVSQQSQDLEDFKQDVKESYVTPNEVTDLLNNYSPDIIYKDRWVATDIAGELAGKTGAEIAAEKVSYNTIFDKILFQPYTPTISNPSINVALKEDWGNGSNKWFDEKNRILLVQSGSTGPDGSDFYATNVQNAIINYPTYSKYNSNYTNGLVLPSDKQSSVGFCKVLNNGEWDYYKKDGNIYHVPAILEEGEYRYYMAAFFKKGYPAINNDGLKISEWNENTAIESEDYITIIATSPSYYNTTDGMVEYEEFGWNYGYTNYIEFGPTCQMEHKFSLPHKIKKLYTWNDIAGGYAETQMVYTRGQHGGLTNNLVPVGYKEVLEDNGYYTYTYDTTSGHRGAVKIKIEF